MSRNDELVEDLRGMIRDRKITAVIGSGVSRATNPAAPMWDGLVASGIDRCQTLGLPEDECESARTLLEVGSLRTLLLAAELVESVLKESGGGELKRWLGDSFKKLKPRRPAVVRALAALNVPLLTTNYDDLIEQATDLKHVSWRDTSTVTSVVRGDDRRVLHLHGHWDESESVVLGIRSYIAVTEHAHTQAVMKALGVTSSFLFIGCGAAGLKDPNWGRFLEWLRKHDEKGAAQHRHYRLVCEKDRVKDDSFDRVGQLYCLKYGEDYGELAGFLKRLAPPQPESDDGDQDEPAHRTVITTASPGVSYYLRRLETQTATLELLGLGRSLQVELPISEAYVPLRASLQHLLEGRKTDRLPGSAPDEHAESSADADTDLNHVFGPRDTATEEPAPRRERDWPARRQGHRLLQNGKAL